MKSNSTAITTRFILYKMFSSMWFIGAVWLYFYRIYINDQQVGILDGLSFFIGLVAEVPSGALADTIGRKRLVFIGQLMAGVGLVVQALGNSFWQFFLGQTVLMVGLSFTSGADEALFFSAGKFDNKPAAWRRIVMRAGQFGLLGSVFALTVGGWLHSVQPRLPWLLTSAAFIVSSTIVLSVKEIQQKAERLHSTKIREYLANIKDGFSYFASTNLKYYLPLIVSLQGLYYINGYGLLRIILLDRFRFTPLQGSILIAVCGVVTIAILYYLHKVTNTISEKKVISFIVLSAIFSLVASVFDIGYLGILVIILLYVGEHILYPYMSDILNKHSEEKHRATVLSVASFIRMIPYVLLAPLIGALNTSNILAYFLVPWAMFIGASLALYMTRIKKTVKTEIIYE